MKRKGRSRAFTLVEVMIVIAIISVLAALAIQGVERYLTAAKASEAIQCVGHISRSAQAAYEREQIGSKAIDEGKESDATAHQLCETAAAVPNYVPQGKKYQPSTVAGVDFEGGTDEQGWKCLRYSNSQPIYYQYHYTKGDSVVAPGSWARCPTGEPCYEAGAQGDLNGNGKLSRVARTGHVNVATNQLKASTVMYIENEAE
jgi:type IV pilus assembly protein PilA